MSFYHKCSYVILLIQIKEKHMTNTSTDPYTCTSEHSAKIVSAPDCGGDSTQVD